MLNLYRRHAETCRHFNAENPQQLTKCACPIWYYGNVKGREIRKSMRMRDWGRAEKQVKKWLKNPDQISPAMTIAQAVESYLTDCESRNLQESTVNSYRKTLGHLAARFGASSVAVVDLHGLSQFRADRRYIPLRKGSAEKKIEPSTSIKELETLRAFFGFCVDRGWCETNAAKKLKRPKDRRQPTQPFTAEEVAKILAACDQIRDDNPRTRSLNRLKARARVLVMLYTGLRISDVVALRQDAINYQTGRLSLTTIKTGRPVKMTLAPEALDTLRAIPPARYFFWSGTSGLRSAIGNARQTLYRVFKLAGIVDGHPHRFRDTFSVSLLNAGEDIRTVQLLLGHSSIKTTEKYYAPFVKETQSKLDAATARLSFGKRTRNRTIEADGEKHE